MSQPYIGEIRMFGGNFAPAGWVFCAGQLMPISENDALFTLIGTTFGGDGQETFGIPDLQGRVPVHMGQGPGISQTYILGEKAGVESVTITTNTMAAHNHPMIATNSAAQLSPANATMATPTGTQAGLRTYSAAAPNTTLNPASIGLAGGSQPHDNFQQTLCVSYIMSLFGIFPHQ
jgi:microcystin-dependent protein